MYKLMGDNFENLDPAVQAYIEQLQDPVQFLIEELRESEKRVSELSQVQGHGFSGIYGPEDIRQFYPENTVAEVLEIFKRHGKDIENLKQVIERLDIDMDAPGTRLLKNRNQSDPEELKKRSKKLRDKVDEKYDFEF